MEKVSVISLRMFPTDQILENFPTVTDQIWDFEFISVQIFVPNVPN